MSETCRAHKKQNKIASDIKLVFYSSVILQILISNIFVYNFGNHHLIGNFLNVIHVLSCLQNCVMCMNSNSETVFNPIVLSHSSGGIEDSNKVTESSLTIQFYVCKFVSGS